MEKEKLIQVLLASVLGLFIGAVTGVILDKFIGKEFFSIFLLQEAIRLELYIIKVEIQLTPASLAGLVVTAYFALKKG